MGRRANPAYSAAKRELAQIHRRGDRAAARELRQRMRSLPSKDLHDPGYRRLRYVRYADDQILGFAGPKAEAMQIRDQLAAFLRDELKLGLSADKTLITHARTRAARFLGYEIIVQQANGRITNGRRATNGRIALRVPRDVITAKCAPYLQHGTPWHRGPMQNLDDHDIVKTFGAEYRGIVGYYLLATDVWRFNRLRWFAETSMLKTLAAKHQSTVTKMAAKHKTTIDTPHGLRTCFEARVERYGKQVLVARFGGIPLTRDKATVLTDRIPARPPYPRKELVTRLLRRRCELCEEAGKVVVHQVRKLASLGEPGPGQPVWAALMARKQRKTLVVCHPCHETIHHRQPTANTA